MKSKKLRILERSNTEINNQSIIITSVEFLQFMKTRTIEFGELEKVLREFILSSFISFDGETKYSV